MIAKNELHAADLYDMSLKTLQSHLSLDINGYRCSSEMALSALVKAALDNSSLNAVCDDLDGLADANTIREHLNSALDVSELAQQECEMNAALAAGLPHELARAGMEVAIDFHDEPFYGKTDEARTYSCRDRAKKGTTRFIRIASASVIWRGLRLTLALTYVLPEYSTLQVLQRLLQRLSHLGIRPGVLYLDKGFCHGEVIRYLQAQKQPSVLACPIRGKQNGGTRALCRGRKSYRTRYTFTDGTEAEMAVVATLPRGKHGRRRRRKWLLFVLIELDWTLKVVMRCYRRRFGIECTYRQMRQLRVVSSSRNPAMKFFLLGLSLTLVNLWARLRWQLFRRVGRGPRTVMADAFRLKRFISMLRRAIETRFNAVMAVHTTAPPQIVNY
ncbi:MAG: transposase [Chloroflexota bacterium]